MVWTCPRSRGATSCSARSTRLPGPSSFARTLVTPWDGSCCRRRSSVHTCWPATLGGWSLLVRPEPFPLTDVALWFAVWGFVPVLLRPAAGAPAVPGRTAGDASVATGRHLDRHRGRDPVDAHAHPHGDRRRDWTWCPQAMNPIGLIGPPIKYVTLLGSFVALFGGTLLGLLSLRTRARRSVGSSRAQLQWLSLGGVVLVTGLIASVHCRRRRAAGRGLRRWVWPVRRSRSRWRCCVTSCSTSSSRSTARSCSSCSARSSWASTSAWSSPWAASRRRRGSAWPSSRSWRSWQPADATSCRRVSTAGCSGTAATPTPSSPASGATSRRRASRRRRCSAWSTRCVTRSDFHTSPSTGR